MKFSFRNNVILGFFLILSLFLFSGCMKEDNWADWKNVSEQWYTSHKNDEGFKLLPSGVAYKMLSYGRPEWGKPQDSVYSHVFVNYVGKLFNDSVFDSGKDVEIQLGSSISGFKEVLFNMHPGDSCEIRIPWNKGYGSSGSGYTIPPYSTIVFNVRLERFLNPQ